MSEKSSMGVKKQLGLAFGLLAALVLVVSLVAIRALSSTNESFTRYNETVAAQSNLANQLADAVNSRAVAARNLVLVDTTRDIEVEKAAVIKAHEATQSLLKQLQASAASIDNPAGAVMVAKIAEIEGRYGPVALDIVDKALRGAREEAVGKMNDECRPLLAALLAALHEYVQANVKAGDDSVLAAAENYQFASMQMWGASALAIAAAVFLGWLITRNLFGALGAEPAVAARLARAVAQGNLDSEIRLQEGDTRSLMAQLQTMQESLASVVANVRQNARGVAHASAEIEGGNSDLSNRTESQASALEETAASMEELGSTVRQNADNALSANQLAMAASKVATQGGQVVSQVVDTMKGINDSSQRIADIIGVIDSIAFQTNILALNAAVEAARAGEQGRGFAVVAGEVRTLAQRSASAAREIKELITTSVEQTEKGSRLVDQAGSTMEEVVSAIRRVTDIMGEISAASKEQSAGVSQVGEAITQMDQATQQNAALVEESAAAAKELRERAHELVRAVEVFRLPLRMIENEELVMTPKTPAFVPNPQSAKPVQRTHTPQQTQANPTEPAAHAASESAALPAVASGKPVQAASGSNDGEWETF